MWPWVKRRIITKNKKNKEIDEKKTNEQPRDIAQPNGTLA